MTRTSVFPAGLRLEGSIEGEGDLIVAGTVTGPVRVQGSLLIEREGRVEGDVSASSVVIRGVLAGHAEAKQTIRVEPSAVVVGDATAPRVSIQEGAKIRGKVRMSGEPLVPKTVRRRRSRGTREEGLVRSERETDPPVTREPAASPAERDGAALEGGEAPRAEEPPAPRTRRRDRRSRPAEPEGERRAPSPPVPEAPVEDRRPRRKKRKRGRRPPPPTMPVVQRQKARRKDRPQGSNPPA